MRWRKSTRAWDLAGATGNDFDRFGISRRRPDSCQVQPGRPRVAVGEGTSPAMQWANAPEGTQSFMLHMHDMDVTRNKTNDDQVHWVVWNIQPSATGIAEGVPKASQLADGAYKISATGPMYRGPGAPANGPFHHNVLELYALDSKLDVKPSADAFETRANVIKAIQGQIFSKSSLWRPVPAAAVNRQQPGERPFWRIRPTTGIRPDRNVSMLTPLAASAF
jgi:Raf kinase inhibitor-like YbhB/YbcL family protein